MKRKLPKYVIIKNGAWHVRRTFAKSERDTKGRLLTTQVVRKVEPETPAAAEALSAAIVAAWHEKKIEVAKPITVNTAVNDFVEAKKHTVARRTSQYYEWTRDKYITPHNFGCSTINDLTPRTVQQFYADLRKTGTSSKMIRKINNFLSMCFRQAVRWEMIRRNPCDGVVLPKVEAPNIEVMDQAEARRFMAVCLANPKYLVLGFALESGLRPGEYLALQWKNVDLDKCSVLIERSVGFPKGGGLYYKLPKTKAGKRTVRISEQMRDALVKIKRKGDLVFPAGNGKPMKPNNLGRREMAEACAEAGLGKYSLYALRHTSFTLSLAAGVDIKTISAKAGHSTIQLTLDSYSHILKSMEDSGVVKLAEVLY